ncbi:MAG: hypothetical protein QXO97_06920 [Candidatus Nezhaarchaeales archaeon]
MSTVVEIGWIVDEDVNALMDSLRIDLSNAHPMVISGNWSLNAACHLLSQVAYSTNLAIISPYTAEAPQWLQHLCLGLNSSFNPFRPVGDKLVYAHFIADVFKGVFGLNNAQASALRRALIRAYLSNKEPAVEDVVSALEIESTELTNRDAVELIDIVEVMCRGRLKVACSDSLEITNLQAAISMSELPPSYSSILFMAMLMHLASNSFKGILVLCDLDVLKEFLGPAWRNFVHLFNRSRTGCSTIIACTSSVSSTPLELRARARMTVVGSPITSEDIKYVSAMVGRRALKLLNSRERFAYHLISSSGVVEIPLEETVTMHVEEELKVPLEAPRSMLHAKLGNKAKMAYEVLSFLRDGASTRDSVISYAMHRLDMSSLEASRLVNALIVHGLVSEVVGADGKYWLKITVRGLNAVEELEALEGWLTRE